MKFFVDTAEIDAIKELHALGMVDGVTTNPSLIAKSGRDILGVTKEICDLVEGPVSAEVIATKADDMIEEKTSDSTDSTPDTDSTTEVSQDLAAKNSSAASSELPKTDK